MTTSELKKERDKYFELAENLADAMEEILQENSKHIGKWRKGKVALDAWKGKKPLKPVEQIPEAQSVIFIRPAAEYTNVGGMEVVMKKYR